MADKPPVPREIVAEVVRLMAAAVESAWSLNADRTHSNMTAAMALLRAQGFDVKGARP